MGYTSPSCVAVYLAFSFSRFAALRPPGSEQLACQRFGLAFSATSRGLQMVGVGEVQARLHAEEQT